MLTAEDLAQRWQINTRTLANWRASRKGPSYVRIGRKAMYREEDVIAWEQQQLSSAR